MIVGDLTKNLSRSEFACRCGCGFDTVDVALALELQHLVDVYELALREGVKIVITGPNRCKEHNESVGGAETSQHLHGRAADFKMFRADSGEQVDPEEIYEHLDVMYAGKFGVGRYHNRTHFDTRSNGGARWSA